MTRVMDGVRRTSVMPMARPVQMPAAEKPVVVVSRRFVVGMDGIRRPVAMATPRDVLANMHTPEARDVSAREPRIAGPTMGSGAATLPLPAVNPMAAIAEVIGPWKLPSLRLPEIEWQRPAMAFGLVATALVASTLTVKAITTPRVITAQADVSAASIAPTPAINPAAAALAQKQAGLQKILDDFVAAHGDSYGIVVKDLKTGETARINADRQMTSASLYKLFVAQRIYQRIDLGQLGYGQPAGGGTGRNIEQCLTIMINISDNGCGRALGTILGWGSQDQALKLEGYNQTSLRTPQQTSAADVATMFTRLYDGTLVSANSTSRFLGLLKDQRVNNRLPIGLPNGTVIAHKTGDLDGYVHDAGIVYGPKTDYLVVVTSGPWKAPAGAPASFAELSQKLWNYFQQ